MALDWSKQISFSGLKKRAPKPKEEYPSKTYINLIVEEKRDFDLRGNARYIVILVVVVALFLKFGVFDFYGQVAAKQAELASHQQTLSTLNAELANYDKVLEEYEGYEALSISGEGLKVNALDVLNLVDKYVRPSATVTAMSLKGDVLTLNLSDISLDGVGNLVSTLYEQDMVANVSVSTAGQEASGITATLTVTLTADSEQGA